MAATAPDPTRDSRPAPVWSIVFWVTAAATALPLFAARWLPLTDLPEHVAVIATLARLLPGGGGAPYDLALGDSQYLLFHTIGALIARVVGDAVLANRLLFAVVAVLWPVSARSLLRAMGRDERLAIFAAMVFWNRATIVGLEPYVASVPLALFGLASLVRQMRATTWRRGLGLALLALAVFYTHASSYVLFAFTAAILAGALALRDRSNAWEAPSTTVGSRASDSRFLTSEKRQRDKPAGPAESLLQQGIDAARSASIPTAGENRAGSAGYSRCRFSRASESRDFGVTSHSSTRRAAFALSALVPSVIAAAMWWHAGSLTHAAAQPGGVDRMPLGESLSAMPIWTFDVWRASHVDEVCAATWWLAYAVIVVASWKKSASDVGRSELGALVWVPFACAAAIYLTTPFRIGGAAMLNVRLAPVLTLFALLGLRLRKDRLGTLPLAMAACAALVTAGNAAFEMRAVEREKVGRLDDLLTAMKPNTRLVMLNFDRASPRTHFWPYIFAGSYHRARGGSVASYSFVELPHWPVHYTRGSAPPEHGPFWCFHPCAYRYRADGAFYDYALVQGPVDPWDGRQRALGPLFVPVARAGVFTLYEKADGPPAEGATDEPDRGPCRERAPVAQP